jgi:tRNA(Arg) A34 adenosine deaminase TadA
MTIAPAAPQADADLHFMRRALELAQQAAAVGEAPIGAVIADPATGEIVAEAHNEPISLSDPTAHAELLALRRAASRLGNYRLRPGLTLYVTLEPCTMCAGAISHARIARLVYGASDPKGGGVAHGARFFEQPTCHWRPQVSSGLLADDASHLLRGFFAERRRSPKTQ